jgi:2-oxo-4-hydroxy-4-carboxy-5-ureidoimidazoline decarboxylase
MSEDARNRGGDGPDGSADRGGQRPGLDIQAINRMDRERFVAALGPVFEHSPWIAERAWASRSFTSPEALHAAMVAVVRAATPEERLALLRAHPELAGKAARTGTMTTESVGEQGGAGLDRLAEEEFARFDRLNAAYRGKFGFPFIIAVRGRGRAEILAAFERRLDNDAGTETEAALQEIFAISRMRLERLQLP